MNLQSLILNGLIIFGSFCNISLFCINSVSTTEIANQRRISQIQSEVDSIKIELDTLVSKLSTVATDEEKNVIRSKIRALGNRLKELDMEVAAHAKKFGLTTDSSGLWTTIKRWLTW